MKVTGNLEFRRKYPVDPKGAKSEWKAMVDHFSEVENQSTMKEK